MKKMAVSEGFVNQLRQVFEVCDVENRGTISITHLLKLAGEHFGSSQNVSLFRELCLWNGSACAANIITYLGDLK